MPMLAASEFVWMLHHSAEELYRVRHWINSWNWFTSARAGVNKPGEVQVCLFITACWSQSLSAAQVNSSELGFWLRKDTARRGWAQYAAIFTFAGHSLGCLLPEFSYKPWYFISPHLPSGKGLITLSPECSQCSSTSQQRSTEGKFLVCVFIKLALIMMLFFGLSLFESHMNPCRAYHGLQGQGFDSVLCSDTK